MGNDLTFNHLHISTIGQLMVVGQSVPNAKHVNPREFIISGAVLKDYPKGTDITHLPLDFFRLEDLLVSMNIPFTKNGNRKDDTDTHFFIDPSRIDVKHDDKVKLELDKDQAETLLSVLLTETSAIADQMSHDLMMTYESKIRHEFTLHGIDRLSKELGHLVNVIQAIHPQL